MKKIFDGKKYDTDTAKKITTTTTYKDQHGTNIHRDYYLKRTGELFVTQYTNKDFINENIDNNQRDIKICLESLLSVDEYEAIFGPVEE